MNVNGEIAIWSLIYLTEPLSLDITHKFAFLSHFGNNFTIKLKNLYCISMTYEDIVRFGGKCKMTQADAKGNDDLQGARFLRNFTSSKSRSTPDRDSLTATSALRSVLRRFCLCSASVLTPFWLRSDSVVTLIFSGRNADKHWGVGDFR